MLDYKIFIFGNMRQTQAQIWYTPTRKALIKSKLEKHYGEKWGVTSFFEKVEEKAEEKLKEEAAK